MFKKLVNAVSVHADYYLTTRFGSDRADAIVNSGIFNASVRAAIIASGIAAIWLAALVYTLVAPLLRHASAQTIAETVNGFGEIVMANQLSLAIFLGCAIIYAGYRKAKASGVLARNSSDKDAD